MAELKIKQNQASVADFLDSIEPAAEFTTQFLKPIELVWKEVEV